MNVRGSLISSKSARIGAFIAEMDYGLAPCVAEAIEEATERGALGYIPDPWKKEVARSCAAWQRRYGWEVDPTCIRPVPDVLEAFEVFLREIVRAGNSIVVTGGSFALTKALLSGDAEGHRGRAMAKRLFSSIPFDCYIVLIAFVLLGIRVPDAVISFVEPIANANAFLSLFMLGLMTSTHVGEGKLDKLIGVLGLRVAACLALSLAAFFLLPYDYLTRCVIATVIWAPMSALAPLYTLWCGGDHGLAGLAGTISIVLGIAAMLCVITCSGVL